MSDKTANRPVIQNTVLFIYLRCVAWFKYLLSKWWIIAIAGLIGGVSGVIKAWIASPKYESKLTFALEDSGGDFDGMLSLASDLGFNIGGGGKNIFQGENILAILTSRRIVESVLLTVDTVDGKPITMADYFKKINSKKGSTSITSKSDRISNISFPVGQPAANFSYLQDSVLYVMYNRIIKTDLKVAKPDKKLNLYEVNFIGAEERFSKLFTEKLVKQAIDFYTELRTKKSRETLSILEERVRAMEGSAKSAMASRAFIQDNDLNPAFAIANAEIQKKQMDVTAYGGAYGELFKSLEMARYQYLKQVPLLQIIDSPEYPLKNLKSGRLKTGLIFAVVAGALCVIFLILYRFIRDGLNENKRINVSV